MSLPSSTHESAIARRLRFAALVAIALLVALIAIWVILGPSTSRTVVGIILAAPFALGAPLLHAGRRRAYAWMTLALAPSLVLGLTEAVANAPLRRWSIVFLLDLLAVFVLLVAYLRATRFSSPTSRTAP